MSPPKFWTVSVLTVERTQDIADLNMVEAGKLAAAQLLSLAQRPTAVVAFNDMIALGLMTELRVAGVSVPKDLSLVGVDDIWAGQLFSPALTSIRQPIEAMAEAAVERIVNPVNSQIGAGSDTTFQPALSFGTRPPLSRATSVKAREECSPSRPAAAGRPRARSARRCSGARLSARDVPRGA
jgi:Periplasmic binding protein-like domain